MCSPVPSRNPVGRMIAAIGVVEGPGDVAEDVDRYLAETGFGKD